VLAAAAVVLFVTLLRISWTYTVNSDGAGVALQAWDLLHGNVLLRGWWIADVSFSTFEIPIDAVGEAIRGLGISAVHTTAAVAYTLLIIVAALAARGRERGGAGVTAAVIAAGILLAPGTIMTAGLLLGSPDHIGVAVPILLTFLVVDRAPARWWTALAVGVLLLWAQLDDPMASFAAAFALAVVCLGRAGLDLLRRSGIRAVAYDVALGAAGVVSYLLTRLAVHVIRAAGGYSMRTLGQAAHAQPLSALPQQLADTGRNLLILFGADFWEQSNPVPLASAYLHLVGVALAAAGLVTGIACLFRAVFRSGPGDRVTQVLTVGALVTLVAGVLFSPMANTYNAHEIAVVLPFTAVLAGRAAGPWLARHRGKARLVLLPAGSVLLAAYLACYGYFSAQAKPQTPATRVTGLDAWLLSHHLTDGIGTYWAASDSRLLSAGRVRISPASPGQAYPWIMQKSWFDPKKHTANFVVAGTDPAGGLVFGEADVTQAFGRPAREYRFGQFIIMVYDRNLLRSIPTPVQPDPDTGGLHL
jgi:hypothetical protein